MNVPTLSPGRCNCGAVDQVTKTFADLLEFLGIPTFQGFMLTFSILMNLQTWSNSRQLFYLGFLSSKCYDHPSQVCPRQGIWFLHIQGPARWSPYRVGQGNKCCALSDDSDVVLQCLRMPMFQGCTLSVFFLYTRFQGLCGIFVGRCIKSQPGQWDWTILLWGIATLAKQNGSS